MRWKLVVNDKFGRNNKYKVDGWKTWPCMGSDLTLQWFGMIYSTVFEANTPDRTSRFTLTHNIYPNMRIHNRTAAYGGSSIGYHD